MLREVFAFLNLLLQPQACWLCTPGCLSKLFSASASHGVALSAKDGLSPRDGDTQPCRDALGSASSCWHKLCFIKPFPMSHPSLQRLQPLCLVASNRAG